MEKQVSHSIAKFAAKFCNELGTTKTSICSPLSAEIVLALLALGCKNQSQAELLKALDMTDDEVRSTFSFLKSKLQSIQGATLNVANRVYLQLGSELKPGVKTDANEVFESSLEQLDFNESVAAAGAINKWVAEKTDYKITNIVSPDMLNNETRVVLVNAMYFKGSWEKPFPEYSTHDRPFHINNHTTIKVPQMAMSNQTFNFGISEELKARLLQIKYEGNEASMVIVLPDEVEGLSSVLQKLATGHNIMTDIEKMRPKNYLDIAIPKFKVETTIDLKELLPKLGIKSIFNKNTSDICMLTSDEENARLFVSEAIQKAFIVVDEKGSEAGCCISMIMQLVSAIPNQNFIADRPFLYLLIAHQIPIFIGVFEGSEYAQTSSPGVS
ncbi:serine protease inhibitor 3/4-like [Choristoneura fumiferana]|uniref:serine protease inhibitor 3/4-like n=1 Tax=Choristoneura fumiferana TaxID=7141 RepID=UPI003D157BFE